MGVATGDTLHHTAWVVHDLEATAEALAASLGVSWTLHTVEPLSCELHGQEAHFTLRFAIAAVGDSMLELLAPGEGRSVYNEQLATEGEGFHHTCFAFTSRDAIHAAKRELLEQRRVTVQRTQVPSGEFHHFEIPELYNGARAAVRRGPASGGRDDRVAPPRPEATALRASAGRALPRA